MAQADQFEQRQERDDHFRPARRGGEQLGEFHADLFFQGIYERLNFFAHRPFILKNVTRLLLLESFENATDRVNQIKQRHLQLRRGCFEIGFARQAGENIFLRQFPLLQPGGHILEFLVFDQLPDQFPV